MANYEQQKIIEIAGGRGIWYLPKLAPIFGINGALMLSQLLYWYGRGARQDGWLFKTQKEMYEETGLTRTQQDTAIKKLRKSGVISTSRKGIPAKRHYKVHVRKLETCLRDFYKLDGKKHANNKSGKQRTITKSTSKSTTKSTAPTRIKNTSIVPFGELFDMGVGGDTLNRIDLSEIDF